MCVHVFKSACWDGMAYPSLAVQPVSPKTAAEPPLDSQLLCWKSYLPCGMGGCRKVVDSECHINELGGLCVCVTRLMSVHTP